MGRTGRTGRNCAAEAIFGQTLTSSPNETTGAVEWSKAEQR